VVALARQAEDLVVGVFQQVLDVVALEEGGVGQHHRRVGVRLERPAQHRVVLERLPGQRPARQVFEQRRAQIAVLGALGISDQVPASSRGGV